MKSTYIAIVVAVLLIGGALVLTKQPQNQTGGNTGGEVAEGANVRKENGVQIIDFTARGGFTPFKSVAQAGIPTILRFNTKNTFDCSSSVRIPSLNISKILPSSGVTDIDVGSQPAGVLHGTCSMGMFPFEIEFR